MGNLLTRIRRMGLLIFIGLTIIIYTALGLIYYQEIDQQEILMKQIDQVNAVVARPLPDVEKLRAEYDEVNLALSPVPAPAILELLVGIARESGIEVDPAAGKYKIPVFNPVQSYDSIKIGQGNYEVLSLKRIYVQSDYNNILNFISKLDAGEILETMVLRRVEISTIELAYAGEEEARRKEFRDVIAAVADMISENNLANIPSPLNYRGGVATNNMGDNPDTAEVVEGFPDITTIADEKGYTGNGTLKKGYVLYGHDKILVADTDQFENVNYIDIPSTSYYYTAEADGRVRQFDRSDLSTAIEYTEIGLTKIETVAFVDVDIYSTPRKPE